MSYRDRDHSHGAAERGNDWLDGALAGWLLFIAISAGQLAWFAVRDGGSAQRIALEVAAPVLAVAAIFPLLRFRRIGWMLAVATLGLMAVREGMLLASRPASWQSTAAFLVVNLLGLAYLVWIIPEFWARRHADDDAAPAVPAEAARSTGAAPAQPAGSAPTLGNPAGQALAAIHHRIVAAGSACAVTPVSVRAEAGRFGVTPAALRTEGLALYRTFLQHFLADGPLSPDEERELICLERALDLDDDGVWRLRAEAGLVGGPVSTAPILSVLSETVPDAVAPGSRAPVDDEPARLEALPAAPAAEQRTSVDAITAGPVDDGHSRSDAAYAPVEPYPAPPSSGRAGFDPPVADPPPFAEDGLADYEEHELGALLAWAGIPSLPRGAARRPALERLRALHRTSTEPLEPCAPDQPLEPGERCLALRTVELYRGPAAAAPAPADLPGPVLDPRALVSDGLEQDRDLAGFQRTGAC
ncbi:MAG TPA: hypothetical protein VK358_02775, partial [Longimicrobium sp.]|nr:hypothetical protein [Longimicrobium sp.]